MNASARREVRRELRAVEEKLREWDPIGALSEPDSPRDEYDSYAPGVLGLLRRGADVDTLAAHLNNIATVQMGLKSAADGERGFAERLIMWWRGGNNAA